MRRGFGRFRRGGGGGEGEGETTRAGWGRIRNGKYRVRAEDVCQVWGWDLNRAMRVLRGLIAIINSLAAMGYYPGRRP